MSNYDYLSDDELEELHSNYERKARRKKSFKRLLPDVEAELERRGMANSSGSSSQSAEMGAKAPDGDPSGWRDVSLDQLQEAREKYASAGKEYERGGWTTVVKNIDAELARRSEFGVAELSVATQSGNAPHPGEPTVVSGTAIGHRDSTFGSSQTAKVWDGEALRPAVDSLEGKPIVANHENSDVREVVGQVTDSRWSWDEKGVVFEGEIDDPQIAQQIDRGRLDVSARVIHKPESELSKNSKGELLIRNPGDVKEFDNLSIVTSGASPSASIETGALRSN